MRHLDCPPSRPPNLDRKNCPPTPSPSLASPASEGRQTSPQTKTLSFRDPLPRPNSSPFPPGHSRLLGRAGSRIQAEASGSEMRLAGTTPGSSAWGFLWSMWEKGGIFPCPQVHVVHVGTTSIYSLPCSGLSFPFHAMGKEMTPTGDPEPRAPA